MSDFTKAQVFSALCVPLEDIIDWAVSLLMMDYDSPSLRILAGLTHVNNRQEITYYVDKTLQEFNVYKLEGKAAVLAYTAVLLKDFINGKISQAQGIGEIHQLCLNWDYLEEIFDFYLLWNALDDFRYDDVQFYWPNATKENISNIIREQAKKWLETYNL
ncbi:hypothetical protein VB715_08270 [Crocosphaera sp. UHCC 0190]|uniref:hypothetical protein n=1 Tax=Crocosphaera sp. UHCC 0190 TaxID=3110246 RepID=UPI002B1F8297|nr:hypothetical protein [Crocosphaera sp. UHCC 0190]MEA5509757.1 hypothetical protein [Crocosphaera sp. UHCC 0190]